MKKSSLIYFLLILFLSLTCSRPFPNNPSFQVRKLYFTSRYIDKQSFFLVYVPQRIDGPAPVLYLLNGSGQDPYGWQTGADLQSGSDAYDMIIVSVASYDKPYMDNPYTGDFYESYIMEIVDIVDKLFDTKASRKFRGIGGFTLGGGGALWVGSRHPDKFISISCMSGDFTVINQANWDNLKNQLLYIDCGTEDSLLEINRLVHQTLLDKNILHFYFEFPGDHTYKYMKQHYEEHLNFHSEVFKTGY